MLKNFLEICISIPFSTLRGMSVQGGGQGTALPSGHQFMCLPKAPLFSTKPLGCTAMLAKGSRCRPRRLGLHPSNEAHVVHYWMCPVVRNMWGRTTFNFTRHRRKWSLKQLCCVLNFKSHFTLTPATISLSQHSSNLPLFF